MAAIRLYRYINNQYSQISLWAQSQPCDDRRQIRDSIKHEDAQLVRCSVQQRETQEGREKAALDLHWALCTARAGKVSQKKKEEMTSGEGKPGVQGGDQTLSQAGLRKNVLRPLPGPQGMRHHRTIPGRLDTRDLSWTKCMQPANMRNVDNLLALPVPQVSLISLRAFFLHKRDTW